LDGFFRGCRLYGGSLRRYKKLKYDLLKDFAPVSLAATVPQLPQLPTSAEAGMPDLLMTTWYGVATPAGVRSDISARLHKPAKAISHREHREHREHRGKSTTSRACMCNPNGECKDLVQPFVLSVCLCVLCG
jgi:hypothetical protein